MKIYQRQAMTGKTNHFYLVSGAHSTVVVLTCLFIQKKITNNEQTHAHKEEEINFHLSIISDAKERRRGKKSYFKCRSLDSNQKKKMRETNVLLALVFVFN